MSNTAGPGTEKERFNIGKYWLGQERNRRNWYMYWYAAGSRKIRRRSLGTESFEQAKLELAAYVFEAAPEEPQDPENVMVISALNHYWVHYSDKRPNPENARRPGDLLMEFLDDNAARVSELTRIKQQSFMRWLADPHTYNMRTPTISRHLSIINAALNFSTNPQIIEQEGERIEVVILKYKPKIFYNERDIIEVTGAAPTEPVTWIPTYEQLAQFIDCIDMKRQPQLFRYVIMALNTWARPEAITDLSVKAQVNFDEAIVRMNPPGRRQTKKYRPTIRLTKNLHGWLKHWDDDRPIMWAKKPVKSVRKAFERTAERAGYPQMCRYSLRKFMPNRIRRAGLFVPPEQRDIWLGHQRTGSGTAQRWYEQNDPEFLRECAQATDNVIEKLHFLAEKDLFAPTECPQRNNALLKRIA